MMIKILTWLTADLFLVYLLFRFNRVLYGDPEGRRFLSFMAYLLFTAVPLVLDLLFHEPSLSITLYFVLIFAATFFHEAALKYRLLSSALFFAGSMLCFFSASYLTSSYLGEGRSVIPIYIAVLLIEAFEFIFEVIIRQHNGKRYTMPYWSLMLLVPMMSILTILIMNTADNPEKLIQFGLCIFLLWINFFTLFLYFHLTEAMESERESLFYRMKAKEYSNQLDIELHSAERIRSIRHDMKNHMSSLAVLIQNNEIEKALSFIGDLDNELNNPTEYSRSGNKELDSIQNYLFRDAKSLGVDVTVEGAVPEKLSISEFDLNVILGNLIDNAVAAASQADDKHIAVSLRFDKDIFHYTITNTFKGELKRDRNGNLLSSKPSPGKHGIGLKNVKNAVEKNGGTIDFIEDIEKKVFTAAVILYAESMKKNI